MQSSWIDSVDQPMRFKTASIGTVWLALLALDAVVLWYCGTVGFKDAGDHATLFQ